MKMEKAVQALQEYGGPELKLMEVCGTHTASIFKSGIRSLISPKIKLIAGPGCPVCVTPTAYIDKCAAYALAENHVLVTFGDMMKVPGMEESLSEAKGRGAKIEIMYSPFEVVKKAKANPGLIYVIAAVGFETTAPAYGLAVKEALECGVANIKLVTALKTVLPALKWICENERGIDGFICPGHVSAIIGERGYEELSRAYGKPFAIAGFEPEHILAAIYDLVRQCQGGIAEVKNLYESAVKQEGNPKAQAVLAECFEAGAAVWRGLGEIPDSGLYLSGKYTCFDAGSFGLSEDKILPAECRCGDVIVGRISPVECPMFGKTCNPERPYGPCMVSAEGACGIWYRNTL